MQNHFLDTLPIGSLFVLTFVLMGLILELGFRLGQRKRANSVKAQTAQVRALMGATLGLLAFMLAFTFSGAQGHFENRIQLQIDEAAVAKSAFLQADLFAEPDRTQARALLLEFAEGRARLIELIGERQSDEIFRMLERSNAIQMQLWSIGTRETVSETNAFPQSVLSLMEMQTRRVNAALTNRIPLIIWLTLFFTAGVAMLVVGYQAGLTETRSPVATGSLALAFSAVMMLIMDLDRPLQSFFEMDVAVMRQLVEFMRATL